MVLSVPGNPGGPLSSLALIVVEPVAATVVASEAADAVSSRRKLPSLNCHAPEPEKSVGRGGPGVFRDQNVPLVGKSPAGTVGVASRIFRTATNCWSEKELKDEIFMPLKSSAWTGVAVWAGCANPEAPPSDRPANTRA